MPNPFVRIGQTKTSTDPQDHEPITPVMESVVGDNHPYRGSEPHGVADTVDPRDVIRTGLEATQEGITYLPEIDEVKPIPVVIRQEMGRERRAWRGSAYSLAQNLPIRIASHNQARIDLRVINISVADNQWISDQPINPQGTFNLFKLTPAMLFLSIPTHDDIWAMTDAAAGSFIQVLELFAITE